MDHATDDVLVRDRIEGIRNRLSDTASRRQIEIDHRIANSLQIATAILMQEQCSLTDLTQASLSLKRAAARIVAIARLHRTLYRIPPQSDVDLGGFLDPFRSEVADSIGTWLDIQTNDVMLPGAVAAQIGIVICEMATNAVKHASHDGMAAILTIEADTNGLGDVRLRIYDDGPGYPVDFRLDDGGIGTAIIVSTIEQLGGRICVMLPFGVYVGVGAGLEIILPATNVRAIEGPDP